MSIGSILSNRMNQDPNAPQDPWAYQGGGGGGGSPLSNVTGMFFGDAGAPYDSASRGIAGLGRASYDYSNKQWDRQMQGLGGALSQYNPARGWFDATYGGAESGPGAMEKAFSNYGQDYMNPSASSGALGKYQSYMDQGPLAYNFANMGAGLAGGAVDYGQYQSQLNGPGNAQNFYQQNQGGFSQPGSMENWFSQNGNNFNRETNAMNAYDQYSNQLAGAGRAEQFQPQDVMQGRLYAEAAQRRLGDPGSTDKMAGEVGNYARNANDTSNYAQGQMRTLQGPGAYENFVQSDIMGNNPALAMERQEGLASLNQELARRGHFSSGGAGQALGKFEGTLAAKSYENRANRAQQAQGMELARIGQGTQTAQASAQGKLAQGSALQSLGGQQDTMRNAREGLGLQAASLASGENLASQRLGLDSATAADQAKNARLNTLQNMASAGDQSWLNQQNAAGNFANQSQQAALARLMGGQNASNMSDQGSLARLMAQYGMSNQANDQNLQRGQFMNNMGLSLDQNNMARYGMLGNMSNMADTQRMNGLNQYFGAANNAQSAQTQRMRDAMQAIYGLNNAQANQYNNFYGNGGQLAGSSFDSGINAMANAYGLSAQGAAARQQQPFQVLGGISSFF